MAFSTLYEGEKCCPLQMDDLGPTENILKVTISGYLYEAAEWYDENMRTLPELQTSFNLGELKREYSFYQPQHLQTGVYYLVTLSDIVPNLTINDKKVHVQRSRRINAKTEWRLIF